MRVRLSCSYIAAVYFSSIHMTIILDKLCPAAPTKLPTTFLGAARDAELARARRWQQRPPQAVALGRRSRRSPRGRHLQHELGPGRAPPAGSLRAVAAVKFVRLVIA